jgi:hypothetical protein
MKYVLKFIGILAIVSSLAVMIIKAADSYHGNIITITGMLVIAMLGFVLIIFATNLKERVSEEEIIATMTRIQRDNLKAKIREWNKELDEEEKNSLSGI